MAAILQLFFISLSNIFLIIVNSLPCGKFVGGLLLSVLATTSSVLDHYLRRVNAGFAIGFTSVLIIVSARKILLILLFMQTHWYYQIIRQEIHAS